MYRREKGLKDREDRFQSTLDNIVEKAESLGRRGVAVADREAKVQQREEGLADRESTCERRERDVADRESEAGHREESVSKSGYCSSVLDRCPPQPIPNDYPI